MKYQTGDGRIHDTKEAAINWANFIATISRIFISVEVYRGMGSS